MGPIGGPIVGPIEGSIAGPIVEPLGGPIVEPIEGPIVGPSGGPIGGPIVGPIVEPIVGPIVGAIVGPMRRPVVKVLILRCPACRQRTHGLGPLVPHSWCKDRAVERARAQIRLVPNKKPPETKVPEGLRLLSSLE